MNVIFCDFEYHIFMASRRCEYCKRRIPAGLRVDARFCSGNCRVNAHKQRSRDAVKEDQLMPQSPPIPTAMAYSSRWESTINTMKLFMPAVEVIGYRLIRFSKKTRTYNYFPNPAACARYVGSELRDEPFYRWDPFEPASVPEIGYYQFQFIGKDQNFYPPNSSFKPNYYAPIADPQACYHGNRPPKLTPPAVLKQRAALIKRANRPKQ